MATWIIAAILAVAAAIVIRKMYRDKKNGISLSCGKKCSECGGCAACRSETGHPDKKG